MLTAALLLVLCGCASERKGGKAQQDAYAIPNPLIVGTLSSPTSFFIYRGDTLGADHDRVMELSQEKHVQVQFKTARSMQELLTMLQNRQVHLVACNVPIDDEHSQVLHCGETVTTSQVLVQPKGGPRVRNVAQLAGREVWVEKGSKYEATLMEINSELGGRIRVHTVNPDSTNADELVTQVSEGKIGLTVIDNNIAKVDRRYSPNVNIDLEVGFPQRSSWAVNTADGWLADSIDAWSTSKRTLLFANDVNSRYYGQDQAGHQWRSSAGRSTWTAPGGRRYVRHAGDVSAFDSLFRAYAGLSPYDWRFLAAIAQAESGFDPGDISWAGARGLMQVMPSTARGMGYSADQLMDPEINVRVAAMLLRQLDGQMAQYTTDPAERRRFVLAAYNAGSAHVADAVRLAEKYGLNPHVWNGNVEQAMRWKSNPHYYNDPVCRYGYMRSDETVNYVRRVESYYGGF